MYRIPWTLLDLGSYALSPANFLYLEDYFFFPILIVSILAFKSLVQMPFHS